jgi:electron transport complex protein RnfC
MKAKKPYWFPHGVHVPDKKDLAKEAATEILPLPEEVSLALLQSIGRPALPTVEVGDKVKTGQLVAKADGPVSSNIFSSVTGTVLGVREKENVTGTVEPFLVIAADGPDQFDYLPPLPDPTPEEIKARVRDAGLVGLGGAGFPTAVKIAPKTPVDTLILNGAECEPYLTCDYRLMLEETDKIVRGARLLATAAGIGTILIGIEKNKPDCIALFEAYDDIQPVALKMQYPMGSEKHLIYVTTKRKVPPGKLPADVGCIVSNVATAAAVADAVELGKPLYERIITVSGGAVNTPKNLLVRVGTPFHMLTTACDGVKDSVASIVRGGPMTGSALIGNAGFTRKAMGGLLYLDKSETAEYTPSPCLSCGKCADVCPMKLMPMQTSLYCEAEEYQKAAELGGVVNCIECGSCAYVCPAKRPLIQNIRRSKLYLKKAVAK